MNTILNLTNLKFFNDNGQELHSEKDYVIQWKLLPCDKVSKYFQDTINGYFLADIKYIDGEEIPVIDYTTIVTGFINNGGIFIDSDYKDILTDYTEKTVNSYIKEIFFNINNDIELSITVEGKVYKYTTNVNYIFDQNNFTLNSNNHIVSKGENATSGDVASDISNINDEYYELLSIENIGLQYVLDDDKKPTDTPILYYLYLSKINNLATLYPFVHYQISYIQDKVSVGFIAANALLILQKTGNNYHSAYLDPAAEHSIITFLPSDDSEIKIFESDNYEIKYKEEESYDLCDNTASTVEPIVINFCFQADEEGAYQNFMGMYIRTKHEPQHIFFFGTIIIKTEVEGEDERFRTLLTNFGIPDPKYYSNIFAEADYEEESTDYTLINNKSKELFLSYDQIFPYVGTYKALKNAIKFLGYNDIIFKEWYRIQDSNDQERDIAVQCIDTDGNYIKNTLDNYGISLEDFERYNKLNKLTMIYHINKIADDNEDPQTLYLMQKNTLTGLIENTGQITKNPVNTYNTYKVIRDGELQESTYFDIYDIPTTEPIFTYSSEVVLAKLNSVKEWLEKHIIGVNAYIQEITGEGIYIHRFKNQAYITEHSIQDFQSQGIYTPNIKQLTDFTFSEATLGCSLNEYKTLTFDDYQNVVIEDFDFREISLVDNQIENIDVSVLKLGNSFEAPVLGNEYSFKLDITPESGTLNEFTYSPSINAYIADGEIDILKDTVSKSISNDDNINTVIFNHGYNITIEIEVGNIRRCFGKWNDNIQWMIREAIDQTTGDTYYELSNIGSKATAAHILRSKKYISMCKNPDIHANPNSININTMFFKYTSQNKWNLPMFIFKNFIFNPLLLDDLSENEKDIYNISSEDEYILEIVKGRIIFSGYIIKNENSTTDIEHIATIEFNDNVNSGEQEINIKYEYVTLPVTIVHSSANLNIISEIASQITNNGAPQISPSALNNKLLNSLNILKDSDNEEALRDYTNYKNNQAFKDDIILFTSYHKACGDKRVLYNILTRLYENSYTFNDTINIAVNHLGNYNVQVNVFDKYNHIFANKGLSSLNLITKPIGYNIIVNQENSNNTMDFYRYNRNGSLLNVEDKELLTSMYDIPKAPMSYRIYDIQHDFENNTILYDNITYAIDTPKNNDYLIISNLSEICTKISGLENYTYLYMLDENPDRMDVFSEGSVINIIIYDNILHKDVDVIGPYTIYASYKQKSETDVNYEDDSYLIINNKELRNLLVPYQLKMQKGKYTAYIINISKYLVEPENVINNYEENLSLLKINFRGNKLFNVGDVIKLTYTKYPEYESIDNEKIGTISNEVAYRVLETYVDNGMSCLMLNGIVDTFLIEQPDIKTYISYPYEKSVHYAVKVVGDSTEYSVNVGYKGYRTQKTKLKYNPQRLFMGDYIDNTFSGYVYDFDFYDMENLWFNIDLFENEDLYKYEDFPITVNKGRHVIVQPDITNATFLETQQYKWKWSTSIIDDSDNNEGFINTYEDSVILRSINNILTINTEYLGVNNIELQAIDNYGNRLINKGEGKLYVKE